MIPPPILPIRVRVGDTVRAWVWVRDSSRIRDMMMTISIWSVLSNMGKGYGSGSVLGLQFRQGLELELGSRQKMEETVKINRRWNMHDNLHPNLSS